MTEEKDYGPNTKDDRVDYWSPGGALHIGRRSTNRVAVL